MSNEEDFEDDDLYEDFDDAGSSVEATPASGSGTGHGSFTSSPVFKIGIVLLIVGGLAGTFMFKSDDAEKVSKTVLRVGTNTGVTYVPGQENLDPAFKKALEESNKQQAEQAAQTGGSALPTPVGATKTQEDKDANDLIKDKDKDPLDEWRRSKDSLANGAGGKSMNSGAYNYGGDKTDCVPSLDQCKDLLKEAGLLKDMCDQYLKEAGLVDELCKNLLKEKGIDGDTKLTQCKKLMEDAGILGADGNLIGGPLLDGDPRLMSDGSAVLGNGGVLGDNGNGINDGYLRDKDGNLILDKNGNPIALNSDSATDGYLRDKDGSLILDENSNPIIANGMVDGKCIEDGYVRDKDCNLVLGADGKPILKSDASLGLDGNVHDKSGNVLLDKNGNPISAADAGMLGNGGLAGLGALGNGANGAGLAGLGGANGLGANGLGANGADALNGGMGYAGDGSMPEGMANFVDPNKAAQMNGGTANPEMAKNLANQMRAILQTKVPVEMQAAVITAKISPYDEMQQALAAQTTAGGTKTAAPPSTYAAANAAAAASEDSGEDEKDVATKVLAAAGDIFYAQILTEVNSDVPGKVLAMVMTGPFAGGKVIGEFSLEEEYLVLEFDTIVKDDVTYSIDAMALNNNTSLPALATDVDHHYISRVLLPAAAKFIEGYSKAIAETGTEEEEDGGTGDKTTKTPDPSPKESLYAGFEEAAGVVADEIDANSAPPVTVRIDRGTTFGLLMLDKVTVGDAE